VENIKQVELPIEAMFPRIFSARSFSLLENKKENTGRISQLYELGFYLGGDGEIIIGEERHKVQFGDIRFVPPGVFLCSTPAYHCYTITFDFGESDTIYKNQVLDRIPTYFSTTGELRKNFEEMIRCINTNEMTGKIRQGAILMELLASIFELFCLENQYCDAVRHCIAYMEEHYGEPITLKTLSRISGYSEIHTLRLFRHDTGRTPHQWLTDIRIGRAREQLTLGDNTLEEIAARCGFSSDSHFKVLFKKAVGITPGTYRKSTVNQY